MPLLSALGAFLIWGFLPVYLHQLQNVSPWVITANRVLWTVPWALIVLKLAGSNTSVFTNWRNVAWLSISAACIGGNWTIYVLMVNWKMIEEAALGYFINPLINVFFGMIIFKEKLSKTKAFAVALAGLGVVYLGVASGHFPFFGLCLGLLFALYAVVRKKVVIAPAAGLFWESLLLSPLGLVSLFILNKNGQPPLGATSNEAFLLLLSGPITAIPLIMFAYGARFLKLTTIGMLQYIAPTIVFFLSLYYGEPFGINQAICFGLIWFALAIYSTAEFRSKPA